jgi:D-alanyl-D-alanine carboxypeptidase
MFANAPLPRARPDQASLPVTASTAQTVPAPQMMVPSTTVPGTLVTAGMVGKPTPLDTEALDAQIASAGAQIASADATGSVGEVEEGDISTIDDERPALAPGEWVIQVGAFNSQELAEAMLERVQSTAPSLLSSAKAFTESVEKDGETLWRARFAGFDRASAEGACAQLKRQSLGCYPTRN